MGVKYKGTFKKDAAEYNGLDDGGPIFKSLIENPLERITVVGIMEVSRAGRDYEKGGTQEVTVRWIAVEAVTNPDDRIVVNEIREKRLKDRTGRVDVQPSLFDRDDPQAREDAERVGDILQGKMPELSSGEDKPAPPDDGDDKPKRGRRGGSQS